MKNKLNYKMRVCKKIIWVIIGLIFCTLLYIPKNNAKAVETPIPGNVNEIKILEIEPGNQFKLGAANGSESTKIGDCAIQEINGKSVKITHVTMQQFISMVDEINGKYDVVVVGRKNDGLASSYDSTYLATKSTAIPYRDYTNPLSQKRDYLPLSTCERHNYDWKKNFSTVDNIKFGEYYAENDITKKRANEIMKMIDSKQLVYMDNSIFNAKGDKAITKTNLYTLFNSKTSYDKTKESNENNFIKTSLDSITIAEIMKQYTTSISAELKRPQVNQVTKPTDDSSLDAAVIINRNMKFNITLDGSASKTLKAKLFLDINADGLFKDIELVQSEDLQPGQTNYDLSYKLDSNFVGYLDWKIEIVRENGVKTDILGSSKYKTLTGKKKVRVLQITPDGSNLINLSNNSNSTVTDLLKDTKLTKDYDLILEYKTVKQINDLGKNFKLNGNYDMVILGFADSYGGKELKTDAINEIESFIRTGQSVMFTHDTITLALTNQLVGSNTGPKALTQKFRDYVGQARYPDPYRIKDNKVDEIDIYKNYTPDKNGNLQLTDKIIPHDTFNYDKIDDTSESKDTIQAYSLGTTPQGRANGRTDQWSTSWDLIKKVKKVNNAQINQYPFILGDEIGVATTHTQWYQLNLEDPDVVPWYNMSSSTFDTGDARNYYYTYSKGNITYSGTGHSGGFPQDELKLFINTMIKAERGANHAPIIKCSIPKENTDPANETRNEVIAGGKHTFTVDADDLEHEIVNMHVTIDGAELGSENIQVTLTKRGGSDSATMNDWIFPIDPKKLDRKEIQITIPDSKLQIAGDKAAINIDATDVQGAKSKKSYILSAVEAPDFKINTELSVLNTVDQNDNDLPTPVKDGNSIKVEKTSRVKAGYKIMPQELTYGKAASNIQKEVAVLIDTSMDDTGSKLTQSKNSIRDNVLNYYLNQNSNSNRDDVKMDIMSYGNEVNEIYPYIDSSDKDGNEVPIDYRNMLQTQLDSIKSDGSSQRNLGTAIKKAVNFFKVNNQAQSGKTIIIISNGNPTDTLDPTVLQTIKDNNYNIVTLAISNSSTEVNPWETLYQWHNQMGGLPIHYYIGKPDSGGAYNDIKNVIAPKMAVAIGSFKYKTYLLKNMKLKFNLGLDILADKRLLNDPGSGNMQDYIVNIPNIKYMATEKNINGEIKVVYHGYFENENSTDTTTTTTGTSNTTTSTEYYTDFIIKPNQLTNARERTFSDYKLVYTNAINSTQEAQTQAPILIVDSAVVNHGVYKSISEVKANVDPTGGLTFAKDSVVTFASNVTNISNNSTNLTVTIDPNAQISEIPKVYKINSSSLECLGTFDGTSTSKTFTLNFDSTTNKNIIVMYSIKLSGAYGTTYKNNVSVQGTPILGTVSSKATSEANKDLPDLF